MVGDNAVVGRTWEFFVGHIHRLPWGLGQGLVTAWTQGWRSPCTPC